jgi:hypothetical protein
MLQSDGQDWKRKRKRKGEWMLSYILHMYISDLDGEIYHYQEHH